MLAREVATLIASSATEEGDRLFDADEDAPDGMDLGERITRAQWKKREAQRRQEWDEATTYNADDAAATAAGFAALRAAQSMADATVITTILEDGTTTVETASP